MFFKKKTTKKQMDDQLLERLLQLKNDWQMKKDLLSSSYDIPPLLVYEEKLVKSKYLLLLKEAKRRQISVKL